MVASWQRTEKCLKMLKNASRRSALGWRQICWLWRIKEWNWYQRSGTWALGEVPPPPFFFSRKESLIFLSKSHQQHVRSAKSDHLQPETSHEPMETIHNWKVESTRLMPAAHGLAEWNWAGPAHLESGQIVSIDLIKWAQAEGLSQNSCDLRILRWALTYITKTSKHNFRGLFLQLSSCVFLSFPVSHSSGGIPQPPLLPPKQYLKAAFGLPKLMKKWLNEESYLGVCSCGAPSPAPVAAAEDD